MGPPAQWCTHFLASICRQEFAVFVFWFVAKSFNHINKTQTFVNSDFAFVIPFRIMTVNVSIFILDSESDKSFRKMNCCLNDSNSYQQYSTIMDIQRNSLLLIFHVFLLFPSPWDSQRRNTYCIPNEVQVKMQVKKHKCAKHTQQIISDFMGWII